MEKRKFTILVNKEEEGGYVGRCLELPAAISQAETIDELKANMTEAIELVLETIEKDSKQKEKMEIEISR